MKRAIVAAVLVVGLLAAGALTMRPAVAPAAAAYPTPMNYWYGMTQIAKVATVAAEIRPTEDTAGR